MSKKLGGKIAVITGGSAGIGLAAAKLFVAEGAHVFITGRRQNELDAATRAIGSNVTAIRADAAHLADIARVYATVRAQKGKIDVLFANAGVYEFGPLDTLSEEHYDKLFGINVRGVMFTVQKALPHLNDGASIVLTGSISGSKGMGDFSVYNATKAAIRSFARSWTSDLKARRIRVNVVSPGPIQTPGIDAFASDDMKGHLAGLVPLGRLGQADEVAKAALFLASSDSSFVAGAELFVDGGLAQV
jgi:NAD(P)-dependent dehydrogenase (short-subunit alcohol dehydrogenase family)